MNIITWKLKSFIDSDGDYNGHINIYRLDASTPLDRDDLPEPIATVPVGDLSYTDEDSSSGITRYHLAPVGRYHDGETSIMVKLRWDKRSDVSEYIIYKSDSKFESTALPKPYKTLVPNATAFNDQLEDGTKKHYMIAAVGTDGSITYSNLTTMDVTESIYLVGIDSVYGISGDGVLLWEQTFDPSPLYESYQYRVVNIVDDLIYTLRRNDGVYLMSDDSVTMVIFDLDGNIVWESNPAVSNRFQFSDLIAVKGNYIYLFDQDQGFGYFEYPNKDFNYNSTIINADWNFTVSAMYGDDVMLGGFGGYDSTTTLRSRFIGRLNGDGAGATFTVDYDLGLTEQFNDIIVTDDKYVVFTQYDTNEVSYYNGMAVGPLTKIALPEEPSAITTSKVNNDIIYVGTRVGNVYKINKSTDTVEHLYDTADFSTSGFGSYIGAIHTIGNDLIITVPSEYPKDITLYDTENGQRVWSGVRDELGITYPLSLVCDVDSASAYRDTIKKINF